MAAHATITFSIRETDHFKRLAKFVEEVDRINADRVDMELEDALDSLYGDLSALSKEQGDS